MNSEHNELLKRLEDYFLDDAAADFPFSERLADENQWSLAYAQRVIREYKRFAFLAIAAGHPVTPSDEVDQAWHLHMIYTKSYWQDFCGNVLGKPLHHNPTKGGDSERDKFHDWYERTLESYRKFFGEEPPADIWPPSHQRFGRDAHFARINTKRNWIVPKPSLPAWMRLPFLPRAAKGWQTGLSLVLVSLFVTGCGTAMFAMTSPFDFKGPEFLRFFMAVWIVSLVVATLLRWLLRQPGAKLAGPVPELDPYEVAYLSGKEPLAVNVAIANLVQNGALTLHPTERRLMIAAPLPGDAHAVERAVYSATVLPQGESIPKVQPTVKPLLVPVAERLKRFDLLVKGPQAAGAVLIPLLIALLPPALGFIKIYVGVARNKPVGYLVLLCFLSTVVALVGFARAAHRSRRGDQVLRQLKEKNAPLRNETFVGLRGTNSPQFPLAVGLFGMGILAHAGLGELQDRLRPANTGGCGAGDGCGGDGGGGCGGGGCGGCGGGD